MKTGSGQGKTEEFTAGTGLPEPKFLVQLEPWHKNLASLLKTQPKEPVPSNSLPGDFWPDVFVARGLPWESFAESVFCHALAVVILWGSWQLLGNRPRLTNLSSFNRSDVIYYPASEYLPPVNSLRRISYHAQKGQPAYAKQDIISVPSDPDNTQQTIVTPPKLKLNHNVPMPNIVAWSPSTVAVPMAATQRSTAEMKLPELPTDIVAPPPEVSSDSRMRSMDAPQTNVVAPPPSVQMAAIRQSDIDIGHSEVVGPAPKLPMAEQHRMGGLANSAMGGSPNVVPPPPSVGNTGTGRGGGQLIALSVRPAPAAASIPQGNRRGTFAATPQGKPGAPGTPDLQAGAGDAGSNGGSGNAPEGIYVGKGPDSATTGVGGNGSHSGGSSASSSDSRLLASATPPRVSSAREVSPEKVTEEEKKVFGDRKFYSMSLNMPNLNSAGGSWVIHFAEMKDSQKGDLSAPVARQKVDPAYPTELMRQNVAGTVTLYAVIHSDGSVDGVKVLSSADDRLNEYARSALTRWRFYPATKNGNPVDLEAVVAIPFRPLRVRSSF